MIKIEIENNCVGCPQGCISCGRKHQKVYYFVCDDCGEEVDSLRDVDGEQVCEDCLDKRFKVIDDDNVWEYVDEEE